MGDNNSVFLDQANWGNFAAQAGGIISTGANFYLSALEISVGYGQDPNNGGILGVASTGNTGGIMNIGNNASIVLGQKGLKDNGSGFYLGSDGAIVVDASGAQLNIGTDANIQAGQLSIGNFAKDYSGINPQAGTAFNYAWYKTGSNNIITIGSGATINLSAGIALDGMGNTLSLAGGGLLGNVLNAGYISAGNFFKQFTTSVAGGGASGHYMYVQTSITSMYIGDNYKINLSAGTVNTELTNIGTLSNTGNITLNQVLGSFTFGNGVSVTANSVVVGDYSVSSANQYNNVVDQFSAATSNAGIIFGANASMNLSGAVMLNGANNSMVYGSNLILNASTFSMGAGAVTTSLTAQNNSFNVGTNAKLTFSNGFIDSSPNGVFSLADGGTLKILTGDLLMNGSNVGAGAYNWFQMNNNGHLQLDGGSIIMTNGGQQMTWGTNGIVSATNLSVLGTSQVISMGTGATFDLTGDYNVSGSSNTLTVGGGNVSIAGDYNISGATNSITYGALTNMTVGGSMNFLTSTYYSIGAGGSLKVTGDINFNAAATGTTFIVGNDLTSFAANNININNTNTTAFSFGTGITYAVGAWNLNGVGNAITLGSGAKGSLGNITVGASVTGASFNTGVVSNVTFGVVSLNNDASFTMAGTTLAGTSIALSGTNTVNFNGTGGTLTLTDGLVASGAGSTVTVAAGNSVTLSGGDTALELLGSKTQVTINANSSLTVDGTVTIGANATSSSITTLASVTFNATNVTVDANSATLSFGASNIFNVTGAWNLNGVGDKVTLGNGATGALGDITVGAVTLTNDATLTMAGTTLSVTSITLDGTSSVNFNGTGGTLTLSGGLTVSGAGSTVTVAGGNTVTVSGDVTIGADATSSSITTLASVTFNATNITVDANSATLNLGASNIFNVTGTWNLNGVGDTVTLGDGATGALGSITVGANATGVSFNTGAVSGIVTFDVVTLTNDAVFTMNGSFSGTSISTSGANTVNFNGTGKTLLLSESLSTSGSGGSINIAGGNTVTLNGGASALELLGNTSFTIGSDSTLNLGDGTMTVGINGSAGVNFGDNVTFNAANVIIAVAGTPSLTFGTNDVFKITGGWSINSLPQTASITLGNGATGELGDITFADAVTGTTFNTGTPGSNGLTFGTATVVNDNQLTLGNGVTGTAVVLSDSAVLNIADGAKVNISKLTLDGSNTSGQVVINVGLGAELDITALASQDISTSIPKINVNGGKVIVAGEALRTTGTLAAQTIDFNSIDNGIYQYNGDIQNASGQLTINNFALTDQLVFQASADYLVEANYHTSYDSSTGILTITYTMPGTGQVIPIAHFDYTPASADQALPNVILSSDNATASPSGYDLIITQCFLTGTHLLTPEGEITVENLKAGDRVITLENGQQVSKAIVWAGNMEVNVNHYENKGPLYPVRIKAHAFGLNQPCRDLLVTPEHTIYVDGGLIPARMLVNGRSIIVDTTIDQFTVYHIETEKHSILLSENLTTESYLNTDNRHVFKGDVANLNLTFDENADHQSWENDAAAPLTVARHQVEPIWQRLDRRATQQGYAPISKSEVTSDSALCLITQKGEKLRPVDVKGNTYSFYVPANVCVVAMHSKAALPSEVVGPFLDDRRMLGVLVAKISVFGERAFDVLPADMTGLSGWHSAELNRTDRWTKGLATLPEVVSEVSSKVKLIKIELTATSEYFVDTIEFAERIA